MPFNFVPDAVTPVSLKLQEVGIDLVVLDILIVGVDCRSAIEESKQVLNERDQELMEMVIAPSMLKDCDCARNKQVSHRMIAKPVCRHRQWLSRSRKQVAKQDFCDYAAWQTSLSKVNVVNVLTIMRSSPSIQDTTFSLR